MQSLAGDYRGDAALTSLLTPTDIETPHCLVCLSPDSFVLHSFGQFSIVNCKRCGLKYLSPRPSEMLMKSLYQSDTYFVQGVGTGYDDYLFQEECLRLTFRRFLAEMRRSGAGIGSLLEIGCGYGFFLSEAKGLFSRLCGVELSENAAAHARSLSGADIHNGDVISMPQDWKEFDVIVAINVIEHIYSPIQFLYMLKARLKKGGRIIIATPDIGSFWYKMLGRRWPSFKLPEHVAFYSRKTLSILLKQAGFNIVLKIPFPHAFPLGLIVHKFGITLPGRLGRKPIWLPKTMIALSAEVGSE